MDKQAKKIVHITWEEAHQAEAERDRARRTLCRSLPPSRMQVITVYVSRDLRKLTTSALRLCDVTCNHKLWPSRYKRKSFFSRDAIESIAAYSKELPRLVSSICENALLIAYSAFKKPGASVEMEGTQRAQFGDRVVGLEAKLPESHFKRDPTKSAIAVFAAIILLVCVGTVSYLERGKNLFQPAVNWKATAQQGLRHTSNPEVIAEASKTQYVAPQLSSTNNEPAQPDDRESIAKRTRDESGNFEVVDDSFVRDKPQADAVIIATLRPGTQVSVEGKIEEYLRIRSLSDADVIGYVHEQDAFFKRLNEDTSPSSDP